MKRLFLTSSVNHVAKGISKQIGKVKGMKLAFINTPYDFKNTNEDWMNEDKQSLIKVGFDVFEYTISGKDKDQIKSDLESYDVIYVSGGNPLYMLQKIQESNSAQVFRDLIEKEGKIYIGTSAGSMIVGPDLYCTFRPDLDEEVGGLKLKDYKGLGLVNFMVFPHWGSEDFKDKYFGFRLNHSYTDKDKIILLTNYQYVKVEDDMYKIIDVRDK